MCVCLSRRSVHREDAPCQSTDVCYCYGKVLQKHRPSKRQWTNPLESCFAHKHIVIHNLRGTPRCSMEGSARITLLIDMAVSRGRQQVNRCIVTPFHSRLWDASTRMQSMIGRFETNAANRHRTCEKEHGITLALGLSISRVSLTESMSTCSRRSVLLRRMTSANST